jgi:hypothetical protein
VYVQVVDEVVITLNEALRGDIEAFEDTRWHTVQDIHIGGEHMLHLCLWISGGAVKGVGVR